MIISDCRRSWRVMWPSWVTLCCCGGKQPGSSLPGAWGSAVTPGFS
jgi:hypothetical protein